MMLRTVWFAVIAIGCPDLHEACSQETYAQLKKMAEEDVENGFVPFDGPIVGAARENDGFLYWNIGEARGIANYAAIQSQYKMAIIRQQGVLVHNVGEEAPAYDAQFWGPYIERVEKIVAEEIDYIMQGNPSSYRLKSYADRKTAVVREAFQRIASQFNLQERWGTQEQVAKKLEVHGEPAAIQVRLRSEAGVGKIMWAPYAEYRCYKLLNAPFKYQVVRQGEVRMIWAGARYAYYIDKGGPPPAEPYLKIIDDYRGEDTIVLAD